MCLHCWWGVEHPDCRPTCTAARSVGISVLTVWVHLWVIGLCSDLSHCCCLFEFYCWQPELLPPSIQRSWTGSLTAMF